MVYVGVSLGNEGLEEGLFGGCVALAIKVVDGCPLSILERIPPFKVDLEFSTWSF